MSSDHVVEIKARLDILTLARQYVRELKQAGKNWKALCPFHSEKTPSFVISPDKGIAYCFGCHKGGDVFKFIQDYENCSFQEALQILAEKVGIELKPISKKAIKQMKDDKQKAFALNEAAAVFFEEHLWTKVGKNVVKYLKGRGVSEEMIQEFRIGFSPDGFDATYPRLLKKGFEKQDVVMAGLAIAKDTSSKEIYDRFRQRLMFPIQDAEGRVLGFGGRALAKDVDAKYVNSPETPIYRKGNVLYNLGRARAEIREKDFAIVVEGYMDIIMSHQAGVKNVVASSGTALTEPQIKKLSGYSNNIYFAFDADSAGLDACRRAIGLAQDREMAIKIITIPEGKDPADAVKEDPQLWIDAIEQAQPYMDYYFNTLLVVYDAKTPDGINQILNEVMAVLARIKSRIELDHYVIKLADRIGVKANAVYDELNRYKKHPRGNLSSDRHSEYTRTVDQLVPHHSPSDYLFGLLLISSVAFEYFDEHFSENDLPEATKPLYKLFKDHYNAARAKSDASDSTSLIERLPEDRRDKAQILALWVETKTATFSDALLEKEVLDTIKSIQRNNYSRSQRELLTQLKDARRNGDQDKEKILLTEYNQLLQTLSS